ncbi:aldose epimerase [Lacticaseibacillus baoqingensis]|uniref:Aldose epimerase n=1 Tax=Lacticaseibacillus baoqingensis TaxID=2486013 RepID=A0ABW4E6Y9_9LACO|nr:aldose epimerase [Lacticaseibacillus baoqingensis]
MSISTKLFAKIQGEVITQYTLTNANHMAVRLLTFGARVQQLRLPNAAGADPNLIVGFVTLQDYLNQPEPFGALLGPDFDQRTRTGWQNWNWDAQINADAVTFSLTLPKKIDGQPGTQHVAVTHQLSADNCWTQTWTITTDTPIAIRPGFDLAFMLTGDPARVIDHQQLTLGDQPAATPTTGLTTATSARLSDEAWQLALETDAAGLAVSTFEHIDTTTNFNGILGHPRAAVGLRPLVAADDQPITITAEKPYQQTTKISLMSR